MVLIFDPALCVWAGGLKAAFPCPFRSTLSVTRRCQLVEKYDGVIQYYPDDHSIDLHPSPPAPLSLYPSPLRRGFVLVFWIEIRADIVSACFALPFERRLLLGTEDGRLLLVNYITGAVIDESHPHAAEVGDCADQGTQRAIYCDDLVLQPSQLLAMLRALHL